MEPPRQARQARKKNRNKKIIFTSHLSATVDSMLDARRIRLARRETEPTTEGEEDRVMCLRLRSPPYDIREFAQVITE